MNSPEQQDFHINRLCIVGVGLIGGSLARALKKAAAVTEVVGYGRNTENLQKAATLGVIDRFETELSVAVKSADVVVFATPVSFTAALYQQCLAHMQEGAVATDVGSTKGSVIADIQTALGHLPATFVPAHPVAGTEQSGVEGSFAELFMGRRVILTPAETTDDQALKTITGMWQAAGAVISEMSAAHHDEVLAATSHLPHLLAYGLVDTLATMEERRELFSYAAGGFRDFTRIASSSPEMWADIVFANREALLPVLDKYLSDMQAIRASIAANDKPSLFTLFQRAKAERDRFANLVGRFVKPGDTE